MYSNILASLKIKYIPLFVLSRLSSAMKFSQSTTITTTNYNDDDDDDDGADKRLSRKDTKHIFRFVISAGELEIGIPNDIESITTTTTVIVVVVVVGVVVVAV